MSNEDSLATMLLVSRMQGRDVQPFSAREYWNLRGTIPRPGVLLGRTQTELVRDHGFSEDHSTRIVALLDGVRALAFDLEQLDHAGIWTVTPFDDHYPQRLINRLGAKAPALLHGAGELDLLERSGLGVVGSRNVSAEGAQVARDVAAKAVEMGLTLVSGGARGVDQLAMEAAFDAGGEVVGVLAESLMRKLRNPDLRRAIYDERTVICTPFNPKTPFRVWNAMARNKLIYALSELTVVVAAVEGKGGTWSGATEALRGGFGVVRVWRELGEGPGNKMLEQKGALPIRAVEDLESTLDAEPEQLQRLLDDTSSQLSLFEKTA